MFNETTTAIEFAFPIEELCASVSLQSLYAAKNMPVTSTGEDATDAYGIMEEEKFFINAHIPKAISDLFSIFIKQTNAIQNSMFEKKLLGSAPNAVDCCGFSIVREMQDGKALYNPNRITIIDHNCTDYLKNYILMEWAKVNSLADMVVVYSQNLTANEQCIRSNNFELKKGKYEKSYTAF